MALDARGWTSPHPCRRHATIESLRDEFPQGFPSAATGTPLPAFGPRHALPARSGAGRDGAGGGDRSPAHDDDRVPHRDGGANYPGPPAFADLNGDQQNEIVVGAQDGKVYAYEGDGGPPVAVTTPARPASPANLQSPTSMATASSKSSSAPARPLAVGTTQGVYVISHTGAFQCSFLTYDPAQPGANFGVYSSPALAELDFDDVGRLEIGFGAWDFRIRAINHRLHGEDTRPPSPTRPGLRRRSADLDRRRACRR